MKLGMLDEAINQAQYLLDVAYKQAVHDVGITDWSKATPEDKRRVDIMKCVIFKTMNDNANQIRIAEELKLYHCQCKSCQDIARDGTP